MIPLCKSKKGAIPLNSACDKKFDSQMLKSIIFCTKSFFVRLLENRVLFNPQNHIVPESHF